MKTKKIPKKRKSNIGINILPINMNFINKNEDIILIK